MCINTCCPLLGSHKKYFDSFPIQFQPVISFTGTTRYVTCNATSNYFHPEMYQKNGELNGRNFL